MPLICLPKEVSNRSEPPKPVPAILFIPSSVGITTLPPIETKDAWLYAIREENIKEKKQSTLKHVFMI
jgi:hypothetical protein